MCGGSKSETSTQATETVTTTDYGAIAEAEKILAQSQQLIMKAASTPAQQMQTMLIIGGLVLGAIALLE